MQLFELQPASCKKKHAPSRATCTASVTPALSTTEVLWSAGLVVILALALRFGLVSSKSLQKELNARHLSATQAFKHSEKKSGKPISSMAVWPLLTFDTLTAVALFLSVLAHIFSCLPEQHSSIWWMVDQLGITLGKQDCPQHVHRAKHLIHIFANSPSCFCQFRQLKCTHCRYNGCLHSHNYTSLPHVTSEDSAQTPVRLWSSCGCCWNIVDRCDLDP